MASTACGTGALNTGQPNCVPRKNVDFGIVLVNYLADDGTVNSVKTTDTFDSSYVTALVNQTDKSKRWYPLVDLKAVVGVRNENVTQDVDGIAFNVKRGVRGYDGTIFGNAGSPQLLKALESRSSLKDSYFKIDINGNLTGILDSVTGDLNPIKIQSSTLQVMFKEPSATELQNVNIKFTVDESQLDADLRTLDANTITADLLAIAGLVDVVGVATVPTTITVTLTANYIYGDAFKPNVFKGAVLADFPVFNVTTALAVVPSSVIETPANSGIYLFTYSIQSASDVMTINLSKSGFEMTEVTFTV